jgi:hypothetical protein
MNLYKGKIVEVREICKSRGGTAYGLFYPGDPKTVMDMFDSITVANRMANYIETHGYKCDANYQRAVNEAKRF